MRSLLLAALVNALVSLGLFAAAEVILVVTKAGNIDWMIVQLFILLPIALAVGAVAMAAINLVAALAGSLLAGSHLASHLLAMIVAVLGASAITRGPDPLGLDGLPMAGPLFGLAILLPWLWRAGLFSKVRHPA